MRCCKQASVHLLVAFAKIPVSALEEQQGDLRSESRRACFSSSEISTKVHPE